MTHRVTSTKFLLGTNDVATSLGCVERGFASDNGLSRSTSAAGLASNLGDGIPVVHCERSEVIWVGVCSVFDSSG